MAEGAARFKVWVHICIQAETERRRDGERESGREKVGEGDNPGCVWLERERKRRKERDRKRKRKYV